MATFQFIKVFYSSHQSNPVVIMPSTQSPPAVDSRSEPTSEHGLFCSPYDGPVSDPFGLGQILTEAKGNKRSYDDDAGDSRKKQRA